MLPMSSRWWGGSAPKTVTALEPGAQPRSTWNGSHGLWSSFSAKGGGGGRDAPVDHPQDRAAVRRGKDGGKVKVNVGDTLDDGDENGHVLGQTPGHDGV